MPQLQLYVSEEVAERIRAGAAARRMSVSRFLAQIVGRELGEGWPEDFFTDVYGSWSGPPLERPDQGEPESREPHSA